MRMNCTYALIRSIPIITVASHVRTRTSTLAFHVVTVMKTLAQRSKNQMGHLTQKEGGI